MREILFVILITAILWSVGAAQGKTTVIPVSLMEPTKFVLSVPPAPVSNKVEDRETDDQPVENASAKEEEKESSISALLSEHMVKYNLAKGTADKYASYIISASELAGVDPFVILAIIQVETGRTFKFPDRPNSHGAIGLMQILRRNVACNKTGTCTNKVWEGYSEKDLYDPKKNIELGAKYLKYLQDKFGHDLGITAYNQGEGNVSRKTYNTKYFKLVVKAFKTIEGTEHSSASY